MMLLAENVVRERLVDLASDVAEWDWRVYQARHSRGVAICYRPCKWLGDLGEIMDLLRHRPLSIVKEGHKGTVWPGGTR